jgi:hypothetical protein
MASPPSSEQTNKMERHNVNMTPRNLSLIPVLIIGLGFSPKAQALNPAPDGGYPGGNTAEGQNALFTLTTGTYNTAHGFLSLRSNTGGNFNTAIGAGTLLANLLGEQSLTSGKLRRSLSSGAANCLIAAAV